MIAVIAPFAGLLLFAFVADRTLTAALDGPRVEIEHIEEPPE